MLKPALPKKRSGGITVAGECHATDLAVGFALAARPSRAEPLHASMSLRWFVMFAHGPFWTAPASAPRPIASVLLGPVGVVPAWGAAVGAGLLPELGTAPLVGG